jgi:hypothetical protein
MVLERNEAMTTIRPAAALTVLLLLGTTDARAAPDEAAECRLHQLLEPTLALRRTALAVMGRVPTLAEYALVSGEDAEAAYEAQIDLWLASDEYRLQMRRYHSELLWTNPFGASLRDAGMTLSRDNATQIWRLNQAGPSKVFRGGNGTHFCQDVEQTTLQPDYQLGDAPYCEPKNGGEWCEEGWVLVSPYVDPAQSIKVCAFEAQTAATWTKTGGQNPGTYPCNDLQGRQQKSCGCGPSLDYCMLAGPAAPEPIVWEAMREQLLRLVDDHTGGQAPYHELLTTKRGYSTGPLDHYQRNQAPMPNFSKTYNAWHTGDAKLQGLKFTDETWYATERSGSHAGILTLPAYLLRYQTNRGRANRFRIAFLGQYFVPATTSSTDGCTDESEDLTGRCYCRDCHKTLEPLAAWFGGFAEAGSAPLSDFQKEVSTQKACAEQLLPGANQVCNRFYKKLGPSLWRLLPLEWATQHPEYEASFDAGPAGLVAQALAPFGDKPYSTLAWATVRNLWAFLAGRELDLDPLSSDNEQALLDELATAFEASDMSLPGLVKHIVMTPSFRRMP